MSKKFYLTGPMTGLPQFNFPLFHAAAAALRAAGHEVVSPAEMDKDAGIEEFVMASPDGMDMTPEQYWRLLSRDVEIVALQCDGLVFLPDWWKSRGAKLEAMTGLLNKLEFFYYQGEGEIVKVSPIMIRSLLGVHTDANY